MEQGASSLLRACWLTSDVFCRDYKPPSLGICSEVLIAPPDRAYILSSRCANSKHFCQNGGHHRKTISKISLEEIYFLPN
jgi:hypothetical protein